jgi:hypothetical protein
MPTIDSAWLNGLLSTPLVLPASVAGALAALFVVLAVLALRRTAEGGLQRLLLAVAAIAVAGLAVVAVLDRLATNSQAAERRALLARNMELTARAIAPGSALSCLDGSAGETIENACEQSVFGDAQRAAAAVAYTSARLSLLKDAFDFARRGDPEVLDAFAAVRRAIELDRFGIAAHVLATRDGCTAEHCAAFAMLSDTGTLKANLKVRAFDSYVARYASAWNKAEPALEKQPTAAAPATPPEAPAGHPVSSRWDFPSAASIPPVSIMNSEPPLPKAAAESAPAQPAAGVAKTRVRPVPPKRPQGQATAPPPAR